MPRWLPRLLALLLEVGEQLPDLPTLPLVERTSSTASRRNCGGYAGRFVTLELLPLALSGLSDQVSTEAGELHPAGRAALASTYAAAPTI
jgi:hypothetical protein